MTCKSLLSRNDVVGMATEGIGIVITFDGVTEIFIKGNIEKSKEYRELFDDIKPFIDELDSKIIERIKEINLIKQDINIVAEELITPPDEKYW
jgi:hypothetical protein